MAEFDTAGILSRTNLVELVGRYAELKPNGREYVALCVAHADTNASMTISPDKGFVHCFACGFHNDAIGFLMHVEGIDFKSACKKLTNGDATGLPDPKPIPQRKLLKPPPRKTFAPPPDTPPPNFEIRSLGAPIATWTYRTAEGAVIGYVCRYNAPTGKEIRCWSYGQRTEADPARWECGHFGKPRPLYGLELLAERPDAQVIIVEGEKTADAARVLFPAMVGVTWPAGANGYPQADWSVLKGRKCVLIPDADDAGRQAMNRIAGLLHEVGAAEVKGVDVDTIMDEGADVEAPKGWDLADAINREPPLTDWTPDDAMAWARARIVVYPGGPEPEPLAESPAESPAEPPVPRETENLALQQENPAEQPGEPASEMTNAPERDLSDLPPSDQPDTPPIEAYAQESTPRTPSTRVKLNLAVTADGKPLMNLDNVIRAIEADPELAGKIWYDEFLDAIVTNWQGGEGQRERQWADADDLLLQLYMQRHVGLTRVSAITCHDAALMAATRNPKNECRDWITGLEWDGTPRLAYLLSDGFGAAHNEYTQAVGRCWIISTVARVCVPGCKVDTVPVLEGAQGIGKSTGLSILGGKWFVEAHESVMSKDFFGVLDGHMLVEISEMHSFTRAEVERIKGIISCQVDRYRKAYGRNTQDHARHTVLVCTTNRDDWQRDETGARRFWPVRCGAVNLDWLRENRDQLFAEAHHAYQMGAAWWDVPTDLQKSETDSRREVDSWEAAIESWLLGKQTAMLGDILSDCLGIEIGRQDVVAQRRAGRVLRTLGWVNRNLRTGSGKQQKVWVSPEYRQIED